MVVLFAKCTFGVCAHNKQNIIFNIRTCHLHFACLARSRFAFGATAEVCTLGVPLYILYRVIRQAYYAHPRIILISAYYYYYPHISFNIEFIQIRIFVILSILKIMFVFCIGVYPIFSIFIPFKRNVLRRNIYIYLNKNHD